MKVFYVLFSVAMLTICGYLIVADKIILPGRYGGFPSVLEPPVTYFMAILPLSFGAVSFLSVFNLSRFRRLNQVIVTVGVLAFFIGVVILAPMLKAIE